MSTLDTSLPADAAAARWAAPAAVDRLQRLGLVAGAAGASVLLIGLFLAPDYFFRAYLVGWVYWLGIALGCLAIAMLHHLSRGAWGLVLRRTMEAATRTLPVLLVLFLPLTFGLDRLYLWARPERAADDHLLAGLLEHKAPYLNVPFFLVRLVVYFLIWGGFAFVLDRLSLRQDKTGDPALFRRMQMISAVGLAAYCLAVTFASVDWLMSLDPAWFSTIYGVYLVGSQALAALAFLIAMALFLVRHEPMSGVLKPAHFHDWGKLLLAFVMLWAYFSFSQFLIQWSGNLPEEIAWYLDRTRGGWGALAAALVVFHFAVPFALLLSRDLKRNARMLAAVAFLMLVMRWLDLVWQVEPAFDERNAAASLLYLAGPVAIGGAWLFFFARELKKRPLLPLNDPYLPEAVAHE